MGIYLYCVIIRSRLIENICVKWKPFVLNQFLKAVCLWILLMRKTVTNLSPLAPPLLFFLLFKLISSASYAGFTRLQMWNLNGTVSKLFLIYLEQVCSVLVYFFFMLCFMFLQSLIRSLYLFFPGKATCVKFGPDSKYIAVGSMDRNLRIFGLPSEDTPTESWSALDATAWSVFSSWVTVAACYWCLV